MKTITINKSRLLFGALVVTLGFSKSWMGPANYVTLGSQSFASEAQTTQPKVVQEFNVNVDGENKKVLAHISNTTSTTAGGWDIDPATGKLVESSGQTRSGLQATFTDANNCSTCIGIEQMLIMNFDKSIMLQNIADHLKAQFEAKSKKEKEEKELQVAIDKCEKAKEGSEILDLKKSANREKRIRCLAAKVEADEDDRDAFKEFRRAVSKDIMKFAASENEEDRDEAIDMLDDLQSEYSDNRSLNKYLTRLTMGAKDFDYITELAQDSATNSTSKLMNDQLIDKTLGKWNSASYAGWNEGTRAGVIDWSAPLKKLGRTAIDSPSLIARQYFPDSDIMTSPDLIDIGDGRANRRSIGLDYIPLYERFDRDTGRRGGRSGSALDPNNRDRYRGIANEYDMGSNGRYDDRFDNRGRNSAFDQRFDNRGRNSALDQRYDNRGRNSVLDRRNTGSNRYSRY